MMSAMVVLNRMRRTDALTSELEEPFAAGASAS